MRERRVGWLLSAIWLTAACAATPPELTLPDIAMGEPSFQTTMAALTGSPIVGDNRVDVLLNGEETFPRLLEAVRSATKTVTFETYIFREGQIADELVKAFEERCQAGVRVSVILDAHGSGGVPSRYLEALHDAGCAIVPDFRPIRPWNFERSNNRNHRRILVVDGRVGFTGGFGVDDTWSGDGRTPGRWRETNVRLEGPVVQQLQEAFMEHWREATGVLLGGPDYFPFPPVEVKDRPVRVQVVRSAPLRDNYAMSRVFLQAISAARKTVLISTPYLLPRDQLTVALLEAARRGVTVRVLVPSIERGSGVEYVTQASQRRGFDELLDGGLELHEYAPALLHTKVMIVDGIWATVGSTNFDNRSLAMNDELNVLFYDEAIARHLEDTTIDDLAHSRLISHEDLEQRGWLPRFLGLVTSPFHGYF